MKFKLFLFGLLLIAASLTYVACSKDSSDTTVTASTMTNAKATGRTEILFENGVPPLNHSGETVNWVKRFGDSLYVKSTGIDDVTYLALEGACSIDADSLAQRGFVQGDTFRVLQTEAFRQCFARQGPDTINWELVGIFN